MVSDVETFPGKTLFTETGDRRNARSKKTVTIEARFAVFPMLILPELDKAFEASMRRLRNKTCPTDGIAL